MNEPVAWMQTWENQDGKLKHTVNIEQIGKQNIPLYTHPAKELTDEEILKVSANKFLMSEHRLVLLFARELLRKAQEK